MAVSVKVIVLPTQTVVAPEMLEAFGNGLTVITFVATAVPQLLVTVYLTVSIPAATPLTTPAVLTVAIDG